MTNDTPPIVRLTEINLAAPCELPARYVPPHPSRTAWSAISPRPQRPVSACRDLAILNRVLAGLKGLDG
jgi:hypothetical protein